MGDTLTEKQNTTFILQTFRNEFVETGTIAYFYQEQFHCFRIGARRRRNNSVHKVASSIVIASTWPSFYFGIETTPDFEQSTTTMNATVDSAIHMTPTMCVGGYVCDARVHVSARVNMDVNIEIGSTSYRVVCFSTCFENH